MVKILSKSFLSFVFLLLSVSFSFSETFELAKIADYSLKPIRAFLIKNKLYLDYGAENVFLTVKIHRKKRNANGEIKRLKLDAENVKNKHKRAEEVTVLPDEMCQKIINEVATEFNLKQNKQSLEYFYRNGFDTFTDFYDGSRINDDENNDDKQTKFKYTKQDKELSERLFSYFIKTVKKYNNDGRNFLFLSRNMANVAYLYIDTENFYALPLILPPYQKEETDSSFIKNSGDFLYSFLVKDHIVPIIKSPVTSAYRLFSLFSTSIFGFVPSAANETFISDDDGTEMMDIDLFNEYLDEEIETKEYKGKIKFLIDGEEFFNDFISSAKEASHSVFIQTYIFKTDEFSIRFAIFLKDMSKKADVRVLIDRIGASESKSASGQGILPNNYESPDNILDFLEENSKVKVRTHPDTWLTYDHRKIFIVDRKKAYIGGMNIANEYRYTWHDLMVSLEGPVVSILVKNFYKAWSFAGIGGDFAVGWRSLFTKSKRNITKETKDMVNIRLLITASSDYQIYDAQLEAIRRAKKRIYIENPYFSEKTLIEELIAAKKRGVDVRIVMPSVNDIVFLDKVNLKIANYLIENNVTVYMYPTMTHVKAAVYDGWVCLGSANFNKLSMFKNREINVAFYDEKLVNEFVEKLFLKDFDISKKYDKEVDIPWVYYIL